MRVAVVGFGVEGRAALDYWRGQGHDVVVHDRRDDIALPTGVQGRTGSDYLTGLDAVDLVVRGPSVRPETLPTDAPVTSVVAEFLARCPVPVVGVTGTKGKGTASTATASIVRAAGRRAFVGGNIGITPLTFLPELRPGDVVVLELSNFQLIDLTASPQVAVVLAITPDHLNWHRDLAEYHRAKASIAAYQSTDDRIVYAADDPVATAIAGASPARRIPVGAPEGVHVSGGRLYLRGVRVLDVSDIPLVGAHNVANVAAAVAAAAEIAGVDRAAIREGVRALRPLPHRLNVVATHGEVTYVDDSLSTTPEAAAAAMAAFDRPQVVILGGTSKGVSFDGLAAAVVHRNARARIRAVLLVGAEAPRIAAALDAAGFDGYERVGGPMADVVRSAADVASPGDVVLLSPACASVGEYRDYADRGRQFVAAVNALPAAP